jgi:hypothetical protein
MGTTMTAASLGWPSKVGQTPRKNKVGQPSIREQHNGLSFYRLAKRLWPTFLGWPTGNLFGLLGQPRLAKQAQPHWPRQHWPRLWPPPRRDPRKRGRATPAQRHPHALEGVAPRPSWRRGRLELELTSAQCELRASAGKIGRRGRGYKTSRAWCSATAAGTKIRICFGNQKLACRLNPRRLARKNR